MDPLADPRDVLSGIGARVRARRLEQGLTQSGLARRSALSERSIRRLETGGAIGMDGLVRIAQVLGELEAFEALFAAPPATTLDELVPPPTPERGRRS